MKHIRCAVCGKDIHYTQAVHIRAHEMTAVHMIRVQAEQIRRMSAEEYLKEKTGSGADGQEDT